MKEGELVELFARVRVELGVLQRELLEVRGANKLHQRLIADLCERLTESEVVILKAVEAKR